MYWTVLDKEKAPDESGAKSSIGTRAGIEKTT
jgi:hypothetical protein